MNARTTALAHRDEQIESNVAKIEQAKKASALDQMASRLDVSPVGLKNTLMNTVFKKATDDEFAALIIVSNAYGLNPLTKEIYAFPAKGGGIVPVVSIDGWLRIMNEHPQFDGIEFNDIPDDKGKLYAVEAIIWRKDRSRPIKVTEYLDECMQATDPWRKLPARMLRHKATIQCARYAFGFSGIVGESDGEIVGDVHLGGETIRPARDAQVIEHQRDEDPTHDEETGEIIEEAQAGSDGFTKHPSESIADDLIGRFKRCDIMADYEAVNDDFRAASDDMPNEIYQVVEGARIAANSRLSPRR